MGWPGLSIPVRSRSWRRGPEQAADHLWRRRLGLDRGLGGRLAILRNLAVQQPHRLDAGQLDDPQHDLGRYGHPGLVIIPGPHRDPEPPRELRPSTVPKLFRAKRTEPLRQRALGTDRVGQCLAAGHGRSLTSPWGSFKGPTSLSRESAEKPGRSVPMLFIAILPGISIACIPQWYEIAIKRLSGVPKNQQSRDRSALEIVSRGSRRPGRRDQESLSGRDPAIGSGASGPGSCNPPAG